MASRVAGAEERRAVAQASPGGREASLHGRTTVSRPSHSAIAASSASSSGSDLLAVGPPLRDGSRCDDQPPGRAVGLEVDAGDDAIAEEERQAVIAELALLGRRVDLDAVAEVEQALGARALPDDRIERRQERPRLDAAGQA